MPRLAILIILAFFGINSAGARSFGLCGTADSCLVIGASFEARAEGHGEWGIAWESENTEVRVRVLGTEHQRFEDVFPAPPTIVVEEVCFDTEADGESREIFRVPLPGDAESWRGCSLHVIYDQPSDTVARLYAGAKELRIVGEVPFNNPRRFKTFDGPGKNRLVRANVFMDTVPPIRQYRLPLSLKAKGVEGEWEFLDRDIKSPAVTSLGGTYTIAVVSAGDGQYDIVLLGGADINRRLWPSGAVKGYLKSTRFEGDYDLVWRDASGRVLQGEMSASLDPSGQLLTLRFPLRGATLRFRRK